MLLTFYTDNKKRETLDEFLNFFLSFLFIYLFLDVKITFILYLCSFHFRYFCTSGLRPFSPDQVPVQVLVCVLNVSKSCVYKQFSSTMESVSVLRVGSLDTDTQRIVVQGLVGPLAPDLLFYTIFSFILLYDRNVFRFGSLTVLFLLFHLTLVEMSHKRISYLW